MTSKASKGNYYKLKSANWLREKGYYVDYMEKLQHLFVKGKVIYVKKDILGADLVAVNDSDFILVNSILGKTNIASHIKDFKKYPQGGSIKRWLLVWQPRVKEPDIIVIE